MQERPENRTSEPVRRKIQSPLFEAVFEHLHCPALLMREDGAVVYRNRAFLQLRGNSRGAATASDNLFDMVGDSERQKISDALTNLNHSTLTATVQCKLLLPDQKTRATEITLQQLPDSPFILITFYDLPETLWTQKEIQRKTRELEELFYLMSHNMKSPIVSIQGFTNLLLENPEELPAEDLVHYLERIKKNAGRLNRMVQDLLEFSKLSKKKQKFEEVSLNDIFNNIYTELYFKIKKRNIKMVLEQELPVIVADQDGMQTVFSNLVSNAIQYIGETSEPEISIGWKDKGRFYVFWVKDNGMGIPAKFHQRIFNPFERGNISTQIEGTGVGLAIVKRIVQKHGGLLKVSSKVGSGSTFYFTIPKYSKKDVR